MYKIKNNPPENRDASHRRLTERSVPDWQHGVPQAQDIAEHALVRFLDQVRLASLCVNVCVCTEEGLESPDLVPTNQHITRRITKETTNVGYMSNS